MKKKVVYFLFDFDGVLSLYLSDFNPDSPVYDKRRIQVPEHGRAFFDFFAKQVSETIENLIQSSLSEEADVILAIGSARQTRASDKNSAEKNNHNGFCFTRFADLAHQRKWDFNRLLLPDYEDTFSFDSIGKTMGPLDIGTQNKHVFKPDAHSDELNWSNAKLINARKQPLFEMHLRYLKQYYPASKYDVILEFWDDEQKYIHGFHDYIDANHEEIDCTIMTRHFDWQHILNGISKEMNSQTQLSDKLKQNIHSMTFNPSSHKISSISFLNTSSPRSVDHAMSPASQSDDESDVATEEKSVAIPYQWIGIGVSVVLLAYWMLGSKPETKSIANFISPSNR